MTYNAHIACACMPKLFSTLAINGNNCLCHNIIVYKLNRLSHRRCDIRNSNLKSIFVLPLIDIISNLNLNNILIMLFIKVHSCPRCGKRMKLIHGLTRHINTCTSQQIFLICMQPKQDILIAREDVNASKNFRPHKDDESEVYDIERDPRNLIGKSSDTKSSARYGLSGCTSQYGLLASELSASLKEVRFSKQKFPTGKPI